MENSKSPQVSEKFSDELSKMREKGFAIVILSPEELNGASNRKVEDRLIELVDEVISDLSYEEDEDEDEED